ncbi:hypothetical protein [Fimbriiglobus ruber]|uniref:Cytochrome c domain-containing protein n=1 Tax=Fimbriiglobus ruber TaxID=1908690 RepID=A0A225DUY4_9BACT|nr:hypothetical protein [Fimbriiglobus ruber]OWK45330.1 hypothetical protein FRUB_01661 [Fimbriiglobus ruber]
MNWKMSAAVVLVMIVGVPVTAAEPVQHSGDDVRAVFAVKCAGCHGADLAKPKGRFGYVLDLRRVAGNPEMVIPSRPTESELWVLVQRDEMPPADSPYGPLTPEQKDVVRAWIADGAPDASSTAPDTMPATLSESIPPIILERTHLPSAERLFRWVGKFHLLLLHFPIALVLVAAFGEARAIWQRNPIPSEAVRYCLWLGAMAAIPTAILGWLFATAGNGAGSPQLLMAHRWLGTTAAVWLVVTAVGAQRDAYFGTRSLGVRFLLAFGVLLTMLTAHLGGLLDRGADFFDF